MLRIEVPSTELWDSNKKQFIYTERVTLELEHSLVALSKWEAKWHKAFFGRTEKTPEETLDYIRCMCLTENVDPLIFLNLPKEAIQEIQDYIADPQTATYIWDGSQQGRSRNNDTVTNELIYYWMVALQIPFECQYWHINHLMTLIKVINIKNDPKPKKMPMADVQRQYAEINAARRKAMNSKG